MPSTPTPSFNGHQPETTVAPKDGRRAGVGGALGGPGTSLRPASAAPGQFHQMAGTGRARVMTDRMANRPRVGSAGLTRPGGAGGKGGGGGYRGYTGSGCYRTPIEMPGSADQVVSHLRANPPQPSLQVWITADVQFNAGGQPTDVVKGRRLDGVASALEIELLSQFGRHVAKLHRTQPPANGSETGHGSAALFRLYKFQASQDQASSSQDSGSSAGTGWTGKTALPHDRVTSLGFIPPAPPSFSSPPFSPAASSPSKHRRLLSSDSPGVLCHKTQPSGSLSTTSNLGIFEVTAKYGDEPARVIDASMVATTDRPVPSEVIAAIRLLFPGCCNKGGDGGSPQQRPQSARPPVVLKQQGGVPPLPTPPPRRHGDDAAGRQPSSPVCVAGNEKAEEGKGLDLTNIYGGGSLIEAEKKRLRVDEEVAFVKARKLAVEKAARLRRERDDRDAAEAVARATRASREKAERDKDAALDFERRMAARKAESLRAASAASDAKAKAEAARAETIRLQEERAAAARYDGAERAYEAEMVTFEERSVRVKCLVAALAEQNNSAAERLGQTARRRRHQLLIALGASSHNHSRTMREAIEAAAAAADPEDCVLEAAQSLKNTGITQSKAAAAALKAFAQHRTYQVVAIDLVVAVSAVETLEAELSLAASHGRVILNSRGEVMGVSEEGDKEENMPSHLHLAAPHEAEGLGLTPQTVVKTKRKKQTLAQFGHKKTHHRAEEGEADSKGTLSAVSTVGSVRHQALVGAHEETVEAREVRWAAESETRHLKAREERLVVELSEAKLKMLQLLEMASAYKLDPAQRPGVHAKEAGHGHSPGAAARAEAAAAAKVAAAAAKAAKASEEAVAAAADSKKKSKRKKQTLAEFGHGNAGRRGKVPESPETEGPEGPVQLDTENEDGWLSLNRLQGYDNPYAADQEGDGTTGQAGPDGRGQAGPDGRGGNIQHAPILADLSHHTPLMPKKRKDPLHFTNITRMQPSTSSSVTHLSQGGGNLDSQHKSYGVASCAVDDKDHTRWVSTPVVHRWQHEWLEVDCGLVYDLSLAHIQWGEEYATTYEIQGRTTLTGKWTTFIHVDSNDEELAKGGFVSIELDPATSMCRYVRVVILLPDTEYNATARKFYSMVHFDVYSDIHFQKVGLPFAVQVPELGPLGTWDAICKMSELQVCSWLTYHDLLSAEDKIMAPKPLWATRAVMYIRLMLCMVPIPEPFVAFLKAKILVQDRTMALTPQLGSLCFLSPTVFSHTHAERLYSVAVDEHHRIKFSAGRESDGQVNYLVEWIGEASPPTASVLLTSVDRRLHGCVQLASGFCFKNPRISGVIAEKPIFHADDGVDGETLVDVKHGGVGGLVIRFGGVTSEVPAADILSGEVTAGNYAVKRLKSVERVSNETEIVHLQGNVSFRNPKQALPARVCTLLKVDRANLEYLFTEDMALATRMRSAGEGVESYFLSAEPIVDSSAVGLRFDSCLYTDIEWVGRRPEHLLENLLVVSINGEYVELATSMQPDASIFKIRNIEARPERPYCLKFLDDGSTSWHNEHSIVTPAPTLPYAGCMFGSLPTNIFDYLIHSAEAVVEQLADEGKSIFNFESHKGGKLLASIPDLELRDRHDCKTAFTSVHGNGQFNVEVTRDSSVVFQGQTYMVEWNGLESAPASSVKIVSGGVEDKVGSDVHLENGSRFRNLEGEFAFPPSLCSDERFLDFAEMLRFAAELVNVEFVKRCDALLGDLVFRKRDESDPIQLIQLNGFVQVMSNERLQNVEWVNASPDFSDHEVWTTIENIDESDGGLVTIAATFGSQNKAWSFKNYRNGYRSDLISGFKSVPIMPLATMSSKFADDFKDKEMPKASHTMDIVRGASVKRTARELKSDYDKLMDFKTHGIMNVKNVKNGWLPHKNEFRKNQFYNVLILVNGLVKSEATWDAVADHLDNMAEHLTGKDKLDRKHDLFDAASFMRNNYTGKKVELMCEIQLVLSSCFKLRNKTATPCSLIRCKGMSPSQAALDIFTHRDSFTLVEGGAFDIASSGEDATVVISKTAVCTNADRRRQEKFGVEVVEGRVEIRAKGRLYNVIWWKGVPSPPAKNLILLHVQDPPGGVVTLSNGCSFYNPADSITVRFQTQYMTINWCSEPPASSETDFVVEPVSAANAQVGGVIDVRLERPAIRKNDTRLKRTVTFDHENPDTVYFQDFTYQVDWKTRPHVHSYNDVWQIKRVHEDIGDLVMLHSDAGANASFKNPLHTACVFERMHENQEGIIVEIKKGKRCIRFNNKSFAVEWIGIKSPLEMDFFGFDMRPLVVDVQSGCVGGAVTLSNGCAFKNPTKLFSFKNPPKAMKAVSHDYDSLVNHIDQSVSAWGNTAYMSFLASAEHRDLSRICDHLTNRVLPTLTKRLDLSGVHFSLPMIHKLCAGLLVTKTVTGLILNNCFIGSSGICEITNVVKRSSSIQLLSLHGNVIKHSSGCVALYELARDCLKLERIDMDDVIKLDQFNSNGQTKTDLAAKTTYSGLTNGSVAVLAGAFSRFKSSAATLQIELRCCDIDSAGTDVMAMALKEPNQSVTSLRVGDVIIDTKGLINNTIKHYEEELLDDAGSFLVSSLLSRNQSVTMVDVSRCGLSAGAGKAFAKALALNTSVTTFDCTGNRFRSPGALEFAITLETNSPLKILLCAGNDFGPVGGRAIANAFEINNKLEIIELGSGKLPAKIDVQALRQNTVGTEVYFNGESSQLKDEGGTVLASLLRHNTSVTSVSVPGNRLGPLGAMAFGAMLENNHCLKSLDLSDNFICQPQRGDMITVGESSEQVMVTATDVDGSVLLNVVNRGRRETLRLQTSEYEWDNVGISAICLVLRAAHDADQYKIGTLDISGNSLGVSGGKIIVRALPAVENLVIGSKEFGATLPVGALLRNEILNLSCDGRVMKCEGAVVLASLLKSNVSLETMNLPSNDFGGGAVFIAEAMFSNEKSNLREVDVSGNHFSSACAAMLSKAVCRMPNLIEMRAGGHKEESVLLPVKDIKDNTIGELDFENGTCHEAGACVLAALLSNNHSVQDVLNLQFEGISMATAIVLADVVHEKELHHFAGIDLDSIQNNLVNEVDLTSSVVGSPLELLGAVLLSKAIAKNTTLTRMDLFGASLQSEGANCLASVLTGSPEEEKQESIRATLRMEGLSFDWAQANRACFDEAFSLDFAAFLSVPMQRVIINHVSAGSVVVDFTILSPNKLCKNYHDFMDASKVMAASDSTNEAVVDIPLPCITDATEIQVIKVHLTAFSHTASSHHKQHHHRLNSGKKPDRTLGREDFPMGSVRIGGLLRGKRIQHNAGDGSRSKMRFGYVQETPLPKDDKVCVTFNDGLDPAMLDITSIDMLPLEFPVTKIMDNIIVKLDISHSGLGNDGALLAVNFLKNNTSLNFVYCLNNQMGDAAGSKLALALETHSNSNVIADNFFDSADVDLSRQWLDAGDMHILSFVLRCSNSVKSLDISDNRLGTTSGLGLASALQSNVSMTQLKAANIGLRSQSLAHMFASLLNNRTLRSLDVSRNNIGSIASAALGKLLESDSSVLECLYINETGLAEPNRGEAVIIKTTSELVEIKSVRYTHDQIILNLQSRFETDSEPREVNATDVSFENGYTKFLTGLRLSCGLTFLDISNNPAVTRLDNSEGFVSALRQNKSLTSLNASKVGTDAFKASLGWNLLNSASSRLSNMHCDLLHVPAHVNVLDFVNKNMGPCEGTLLAGVLKHNADVGIVNAWGNNFGDRSSKLLDELCKSGNVHVLMVDPLKQTTLETPVARFQRKASFVAKQKALHDIVSEIRPSHTPEDASETTVFGVCEGYLEKMNDSIKTGKSGKWQRRHFVLAMDGMLSYATKPDLPKRENQGGNISQCTVTAGEGTEFEIAWPEEKRVMCLKSQTAGDSQLWIKKLNEIIEVQAKRLAHERALEKYGMLATNANGNCTNLRGKCQTVDALKEAMLLISQGLASQIILIDLGLNSLGAMNNLTLIADTLAGDRFTGIQGTNALRQLLLDSCELGDDALEVLSPALQELPLVDLSLKANNIGDKGILCLVESLLSPSADSHSLQTLDLTNNSISSTGGRALFVAAQRPGLVKLYLGWNQIRYDAVQVIDSSDKPADGIDWSHVKNLRHGIDWSHSSTLLELELNCNQLGEQGAYLLSCALDGSRLQMLGVGNNMIHSSGLRKFCDRCTATNLMSIDFANNHIESSDNMFPPAFEALCLGKAFGSLGELRLSSNFITTVDGQLLRQSTLVMIHLDWNYLTDAGRVHRDALGTSCMITTFSQLAGTPIKIVSDLDVIETSASPYAAMLLSGQEGLVIAAGKEIQVKVSESDDFGVQCCRDGTIVALSQANERCAVPSRSKLRLVLCDAVHAIGKTANLSVQLKACACLHNIGQSPGGRALLFRAGVEVLMCNLLKQSEIIELPYELCCAAIWVLSDIVAPEEQHISDFETIPVAQQHTALVTIGAANAVLSILKTAGYLPQFKLGDIFTKHGLSEATIVDPAEAKTDSHHAHHYVRWIRDSQLPAQDHDGVSPRKIPELTVVSKFERGCYTEMYYGNIIELSDGSQCCLGNPAYNLGLLHASLSMLTELLVRDGAPDIFTQKVLLRDGLAPVLVLAMGQAMVSDWNVPTISEVAECIGLLGDGSDYARRALHLAGGPQVLFQWLEKSCNELIHSYKGEYDWQGNKVEWNPDWATIECCKKVCDALVRCCSDDALRLLAKNRAPYQIARFIELRRIARDPVYPQHACNLLCRIVQLDDCDFDFETAIVHELISCLQRFSRKRPCLPILKCLLYYSKSEARVKHWLDDHSAGGRHGIVFVLVETMRHALDDEQRLLVSQVAVNVFQHSTVLYGEDMHSVLSGKHQIPPPGLYLNHSEKRETVDCLIKVLRRCGKLKAKAASMNTTMIGNCEKLLKIMGADQWQKLRSKLPSLMTVVHAKNVGEVSVDDRTVVLKNNKLDTITMIGDLLDPVLLHLDLHNNRLVTLAHELGTAITLTDLIVNNNCLHEVPTCIPNLVNLTVLDLSCNDIHKLPESMKSLKNLEELHLWSNKITGVVPGWIGNMKQLVMLCIFDNNFTTLHPDLAKLKALESLGLDGLDKNPWMPRLPSVRPAPRQSDLAFLCRCINRTNALDQPRLVEVAEDESCDPSLSTVQQQLDATAVDVAEDAE